MAVQKAIQENEGGDEVDKFGEEGDFSEEGGVFEIVVDDLGDARAAGEVEVESGKENGGPAGEGEETVHARGDGGGADGGLMELPDEGLGAGEDEEDEQEVARKRREG